MTKKFAFIIGFTVIASLLSACGGGEPNDSMVQTAIAKTQQANSGVIVTPESPAQATPMPTTAEAQGETSQADVSYIPFHVASKNTGDGWINYSVLIAIQYNGKSPITVYDDNSSGGGYHELDEQGFKGYVIPPSLDFVLTTDGNKYPVYFSNYCGDVTTDSDQKIKMAFAFSGIETTRLLPDTVYVHDSQSIELTSTFGACFKVPETLTPSKIILMTSDSASQTIDFNQIPADLNVNFEPVGIQPVPASLKMSDFDIAVGDFQFLSSENDEYTYQAKISITNTVLDNDRYFNYGTIYAISNEGLLYKPEDSVTGLPEDNLYSFSNEKIGPGQTAEATINISIPKNQAIPSQLYFYVVTQDNEWFSFKTSLPTP